MGMFRAIQNPAMIPATAQGIHAGKFLDRAFLPVSSDNTTRARQ